MKSKTFTILLWTVSTLLQLCAAGDSRITTSDGRVIFTSHIELLANGGLEYLLPDGKTRKRLERSTYRSAWIPKPAQITEADMKFKDQSWKAAGDLYAKAAQSYKLLGWYAYCTRMEALSLARSGEKDAALKKLTELKKMQLRNPDTETDLELADDMMTELLIDRKQYNDAQKILDQLLKSSNPDVVFSALFKSAVILQNKGKLHDAAMMFYQTALLFPGHPRRPEALYNAWSLFIELKDPAAAKVADLLNRQYPNDPYTKKVFR